MTTAGISKSITIRQATRADQAAIRALVWRARLYPFGLVWKRFFVAEDEGRIVAIGQIRHHDDGAHELASLVVAPDRRGHGISRELITRLLEREDREVYLVCRIDLERYYARFGFEIARRAAVPRTIARLSRLEDLATRLVSFLEGTPRHLVIMVAHLATRVPGPDCLR